MVTNNWSNITFFFLNDVIPLKTNGVTTPLKNNN